MLNVMEIWEPKPPGTLRAPPGLLRDCFTFTFYMCPYLYVFTGWTIAVRFQDYFSSATASRPALGLTRPHSQFIPEVVVIVFY